MNRATSFVLYTLVARRLGAHEFGQLTLALTLFYTFQVLAVAGLKTLIVRQVTTDRSQTIAYLVHGCVVVAASSFISCALLFGFVHVMHYSATTSLIILLLSLGLFPYAMSAVFEGIFQAWEQMQYIPYVNVPVNFAKIGGAFLVLSTRKGLFAVVLVLLLSLFAIAGVEACILIRRLPRQQVKLDVSYSLGLLRSSSTFLGIDGILALMTSLNIILLSKFASETEVGLYSAATQLLVPLLLVYQSLAQSIFPVMCQRVEPGLQTLKQIAAKALEMLLVLALPAIAALVFMGDWALSVLYAKPVFLQAFPALRIIAWVLVLQVFTSVLGQVLLACHCEKMTLRIVIVDTLVCLVAGWFLINHFGLLGAAVTLLLTRTVDCFQHYIPVARLLSGIPLRNIVWKPVVAAACMAAYLAACTNRTSILTGASATLIYCGVLVALTICVSGGRRQFTTKFLPTLSK